MKKKTLLVSMLIVIVMLLCFCGCSKITYVDMTGRTPVIYELEGGKYQNCTGNFIHYYQVEEGEKVSIYSPQKLSSAILAKDGYTFDGWYKTKTLKDNGSVLYSDPWNFENDKITNEGTTLYAFWVPIVNYSYKVYYIDETTGKSVLLGIYKDLKKGEKFEDWNSFAEKRSGAWTPIGFEDSEGNPWDPDFEHPGGEVSTAIDVYVKYIKGKFAICDSKKSLLEELNNNKHNAKIYLTADIDCEGETLDFGDYMGEIIGNGHTISNFKVGYKKDKEGLDFDRLLNASIIGSAYRAKLSDVTFENVTLEYETSFSASQGIVIGVLGSRVEYVEIKNVKVKNMNIIINQIPANLTLEDDVLIVTDKIVAESNSTCVFEGDCSIENINVEIKVEE